VNLIQELLALQASRGFLDEGDLRDLAKRARVPLYEVEAVVSFYPHLRRTPPPSTQVQLCRDLSCKLRGSEQRAARIQALCEKRSDTLFEQVSCLGRCAEAPACRINAVPVGADEAEALLARPEAPSPIASPPRQPAAWQIDPYDAPHERFGVLKQALADDRWGPEDGGVIARIQGSGLRGMGGAGFSTGLKWKLVREESDATKYVVCNADESEPGTFKDRVILEELPHLVLEGLILAGRSIGAQRGWIFIRHEYEQARDILQSAIDAAYASGQLGTSVCGSDFGFDVEIFTSPGGYILGEETALLEAMEGSRGEPRNKPPYPGRKGLWGKPTLINNVETLAHVPRVLKTGNVEFKFFAVSGDVEEPKVCEVPVGTTLAELIRKCGGMRGGAELLAFLPGGASTGFLPAHHAQLPLDWEALRDAGSALGSGAVVVVAEGADLIDLAHNLTTFFRNESCGKCVPCRVGTEKALKLIESRRASDVETLSQLHETLQATSLCGLGQVALVPITSVFSHFPDLAPPEGS
jgi:NADH:ubiquinone oxidoreductase subunit F (NADH-binding)/NADH:ubiquinone oxidoreductase subunit E